MKIPHQALPVCPVCMDHIERVDTARVHEHIAQLSTSPLSLHTVYAHWYFDHSGAVQHLHHQLKYANRPSYGIELGIMLGNRLQHTSLCLHKPDIIVPIPLHVSRFLERGYNQSAMLAQGIAQILNSPVDEAILSRDIATRPQTGLNKQERQKNVQSAFSVTGPYRLENKHILLIDDVLTTGATLLSAAQTILQAGASAISIATLAFARP